MSSNSDYDYTEREKKVLELYDSGKSTRYIAILGDDENHLNLE